ncbi:MAG: J domain-containing protein [Terracidiphilus sp.]
MATAPIDYYEFLQISPNADADTIHRVYRFLAARLHPDNQQSGNAANFHLLKTAYDVLSDPERRSDYDATRNHGSPQPLSTAIDFMDALEGELNRRLAVLAVLYYRRRINPHFPEISLAEIEERMGFPRDYLDFTLWYLQKKVYIAKADNAQYTLTVEGVDFVETQRVNMPTLNKLLTSGSGSSIQDFARAQNEVTTAIAPETEDVTERPVRGSTPIVLPSSMNHADQRLRKPDRRVGAPDLRIMKVERRMNTMNRRGNGVGGRVSGQQLLPRGDA